jgi:hypothetical protein
MLTFLTATRAQALFLAAVTLTLFMALTPHPPRLPMDALGDKFEHMLAFAVLAFLARFAFVSITDRSILVRLSLLGAMIEVLQAIPALHRDCDWRDWLADTVAAAVALVVAKIARARAV